MRWSIPKNSRFEILLLAVVVFAGLCAGPARSTSYVPMTDSDLADSASVIVEVSVVSAHPAPVSGVPATDYVVLADRTLKGAISNSSIVVRVPGGIGADGRGLQLWGAPTFRPGERALLFLSPGPQHTYRIEQLMLGAFHRVVRNGEALAVRNLAHTKAVSAHRVDPARGVEPLRDYQKFAGWLRDRSAGRPRASDYVVDGTAGGSIRSSGQRFTVLRGEGRRMRWFEFDSGEAVEWRIGPGGYGRPQFEQALEVWGAFDSNIPIRLTYGGRTQANAGFTQFDGVNVLQFNDPNNEIGVRFDCRSGGVLAVGGPWFELDQTAIWKKATYLKILGADIITARNTDCFYRGHPDRQAEVWSHELGHTLGLGHSCGDSDSPSCSSSALNDAQMRAFAHDDGRGARLGSDDGNAINRLYGSGRAPEQQGGSTAGLKPPKNLTAVRLQRPSEVLLNWIDTNALEDFYMVFEDRGGRGWRRALRLEGDTTEAVITGLGSGTHRWRVRAKNESGRSTFSNTVEIVIP